MDSGESDYPSGMAGGLIDTGTRNSHAAIVADLRASVAAGQRSPSDASRHAGCVLGERLRPTTALIPLPPAASSSGPRRARVSDPSQPNLGCGPWSCAPHLPQLATRSNTRTDFLRPPKDARYSLIDFSIRKPLTLS